jgi:hypothetical protein
MTNWVIIMTGPEPAAGMPRLYEGEVFRSATAMYEHAAQHTQHSRYQHMKISTTEAWC